MSVVLVVDDEPAIRRATRRILESAGHEVLESGNGVEALGLVERRMPDVLLTDLHMPGMDGAELIRSLRQSGQTQPQIIILSGSADHLAEVALQLGTEATLLKPFSSEELLALVATVTVGQASATRVLIVDDQPDVCRAVRCLLEIEPDRFRVADAGNGREALAVLAHEAVDVIITDLAMPEMDGFALLKALQALPAPTPPAIVITGSAFADREAALEEARQLGAHAVLRKPIPRAQLVNAIHAVLAGGRAR